MTHTGIYIALAILGAAIYIGVKILNGPDKGRERK